MATVRKTITITEQQDAWIAAQVDAGDYADDSEAIRDLIRREQERRFGIETVRDALSEGEESGAAVSRSTLPPSSSVKLRSVGE